MRTCQNCHNKWSWKQTFKRSFTLGKGMECPYCHELQFYSLSFRKRSMILTFTLLILISLINIFFGTSYTSVISSILLIPLFLGVFPLFVELSNEEEPLW